MLQNLIIHRSNLELKLCNRFVKFDSTVPSCLQFMGGQLFLPEVGDAGCLSPVERAFVTYWIGG